MPRPRRAGFEIALICPHRHLDFGSSRDVLAFWAAFGATIRSRKVLYLFENYALDTDRRELRCGSAPVSVEPQVFDLLAYLIENRHRVVSKDDLLAVIWHGRLVSDSALTSRVNAARGALGDSGNEQRLIKTHLRKGIRFVGAVREEREGNTSMPVAAGQPDRALPALAAERAPQERKPALTLPEKPSIAVLPFTNMSDDPQQDYFADGMAEEIITALSRCRWLFVIARNSTFTYKGKSVDVREVGRDLGVRYVLEGSVRRAGDRLRFTGQLIDTTSGTHIWADRFEGELSDVFGLQDRFTESVVAAIEPNLQLAEIERLKSKPAANLDAYDLHLRAQRLEYEFTEQSLTEALQRLKQALAIDPGYASAMALAACCYAGRNIQGWAENPAAEAAEGLALASRAVELGKDDGNVLWMAAYAVWRLAFDARRARELAYRSLRLNPNSAIALAITAWMETHMGEFARAIEMYQRAERLSPRDPRAWLFATGMGMALFFLDRFDEAAYWAEKALADNPRCTIALRTLAGSLAKMGQREQAAIAVQTMLKVEPQLTLSIWRARLKWLDETPWGNRYVEALRLAGLPE
jgi:TolB-like protein/Tfp pilus assembly protein PilF